MAHPIRTKLVNILRGRPRRTSWGEDTSSWTKHDWDWYERDRLRKRSETTLYVEDAELEIEGKPMDAWLSVLRTVLTALLTWMASKGLVQSADVGPVVAGIINAAPAIGIAIVAIWGAIQHTRAALIQKTSDLPGAAVVVSEVEKDAHPNAPGVVGANSNTPIAVRMAMTAGNK